MNIFELSYFYRGDKIPYSNLPFMRLDTEYEKAIINLSFLVSVSGIRTAKHEDSPLWDYAVVTMSNGDRYFISTEAREDLIEKLNQLDNGYGDL